MMNHPMYGARPDIKGGGDPLGTAATNSMLYRSLFPGINNVVRYVRIYSAICWMVGNLQKIAEKNNMPSAELTKAGLEKIQLLLMWFNLSQNVPGIPGGDRQFPTDDSSVMLKFRSIVSTQAQNVLLMDPAATIKDGAHFMTPGQYWPGLVSGFRFLEEMPIIPGTLRLTEAGWDMASAFEVAIADHPRAKWLADPTQLLITHAEVLSLSSMLDVRSPSTAEQSAFLKHYYPDSGVGFGPNWEHRHSGLTLALRALQAETAYTPNTTVDVETVRHTMARGLAKSGQYLDLVELETPHGWWVNLQVRQCMRMALAVLFRCTESWVADAVAHQRPRHILDCAQGLGVLLQKNLDPQFQKAVAAQRSHFRALRGVHPTLYMAGATQPEADIEKLIERLRLVQNFEPHSQLETEALQVAYQTLIFCAEEAYCLSSNANVTLHFSEERMPLEYLLNAVSQFENKPPQEFMAYVIQHYVVLLHFQVALRRTYNQGDGANRFRLVNGDEGLERDNVSARLSPVNELEDLLHHALYLLAQCGLADWNSATDRFSITPAGELRLQTYRNPLAESPKP